MKSDLCAAHLRRGRCGLVNLDRSIGVRHATGSPCCICLRVYESGLAISIACSMRGDDRGSTNMTHRASVKKASSTPSFSLADVSINLMPSSRARSRPSSSGTARLSVQSDLLPMRILFTPSEACCSMLACHVRMSGARHLGSVKRIWRDILLNDRSSVTS